MTMATVSNLHASCASGAEWYLSRSADEYLHSLRDLEPWILWCLNVIIQWVDECMSWSRYFRKVIKHELPYRHDIQHLHLTEYE